MDLLPHNGVDTSVAAAASMQSAAETQRQRVYDHLVATGGATQEETADALAIGRPAACARFWELERHGRIRKSVVTRPTRSGRQAHIYVVNTAVS